MSNPRIPAERPQPLPVIKASELKSEPPERQWLVRDLWARAAAGVVGGQPKLGKSLLALDMAVSVASQTLCMGRFAVDDPGPALVYFAEDPHGTVRGRLEALSRHRRLELAAINLYAIDMPVLRLDDDVDRRRLLATVEQIRPRILVLDPLVRMHAGDENSAADIARLLGFLTELQRRFDCAVILVHHTSKKQRDRPGQSLRGSSDLHAWGASNLYLGKRGNRLMLTVEHRAARAPDPFYLEVTNADDAAVHLRVVSADSSVPDGSVDERLLALLTAAHRPMRRAALRARLRVNNERLGLALEELERRGVIERSPDGWRTTAATPELERPEPQPLLGGPHAQMRLFDATASSNRRRASGP